MKLTTIMMLLAFTLSACNTIEGMGRDVRNAGEGISDSASKVKEKINK